MSKPEKTEKKDSLQKLLNSFSIKNLETTTPEAGFASLKINVNEIGHIPGLSAHWKFELEKRKKMILETKPTTLKERFSKIIGRSNLPAEASGEELLQWHPSTEARKLVDQLKADPKDSFVRLQLVSLIGKSQREFPNEFYRCLLLQSTVACMLGELNLTGLQIVLFTQSLYLSKLFQQAQLQIKRLQGFLEKVTADGVQNEQRRTLQQTIDEIKTNMKLIKKYQEQTSKAMNTQVGNLHCVIRLDAIQELLFNTRGSETEQETQKEIMKQACVLMPLLRFIPLLQETAHEWADWMIKLEDLSVSNFLKARLYLGQMVFEIERYEAGERNQDVQKQIQTAFRDAYKYYGIAVHKVGGDVQSDTDITIHIEYASLIHYFYKTAVSLLKIKVPSDWLKSVLPKAQKALLAAQSKEISNRAESIKKLQLALARALEAEGIYKT